ncbi:methyl-accepting chemotaxis protein [Granulicella rosea]|uniref:Methyl-accepting chemotaxis protein n=1 Tax=Granulicella rosea TaxID=474952 RepID=A0A239H0D5_9BACT|nr:methyl-accepting chemotaxis protein [Granulicella rosea]SNS74253.1 methyl-accepting chemotaxis protein [Granulicella rosea]
MSALHSSREEEAVLASIRINGDRLMCALSWILWLVSLCVAALYGTWMVSFTIALSLSLAMTALLMLRPGSIVTRLAGSIVLMAYAGVLIHQWHGLIEAHFGIFAFLAFLLYYRDWRPVVAGAVTVALHHLIGCRLQMAGTGFYVFPPGHNCDLVWLHVGFVVFEVAGLVYLSEMIRTEALEAAAIAQLGQRLSDSNDGVIDLTSPGLDARTSSGHSMLKFLGTINDAVSHAGSVAFGIGGISGTMTQAAGRMLQAGHTQQRDADGVLQAVQQMASSTLSMTHDFEEVVSVVKKAGNLIVDGRENMGLSQTVMEEVVAAVTGLSAQIDDLHQESSRIEEIIRIVSEIADQTSLLALNAAIEAARAGDLGRGFAVVAQEVRELSQRTQGSLVQAQAVVGQVRTKTDRVRRIADNCRGQAISGGEQLSRAGKSLQSAVAQLPQVAERAEQVIKLADRHRELTGDVVDRMRKIGESVAANSTSLGEVGQLSHSLQTMSDELVDSVRRFHYSSANG